MIRRESDYVLHPTNSVKNVNYLKHKQIMQDFNRLKKMLNIFYALIACGGMRREVLV